MLLRLALRVPKMTSDLVTVVWRSEDLVVGGVSQAGCT
jgi:hypothetical protein